MRVSTERISVFALALFFAWCAAGQDAKDDTPPDLKAYRAAGAISEPEAKIAALEKFKHDFPDSDAIESADDAILSTLLKKLPGETARIRKQAKTIYAKAKASEKGATANSIAGDFLDAGVLLPEAESYARQGVKALNEAKYVRETQERYARSKSKAPPEDQLRARFRDNRAARIATLGRVQVKRGRTAAGQALLEEAYAVTPTGSGIAQALGLLALAAHDDTRAYEYLTVARLTGRASKEARAAFERIYRARHAGSLEGMEDALDAEYARRFPNPVKVERYQAGPRRSHRLVLAEVFTGSGCPPCAGADVAFDAAMERYSRSELAVVMYHQHIPRPDPMVDPDSVARAKAYQVRSVPSYMIDGKRSGGGGSRAMAGDTFQRIDPDIEKELETPAAASVRVDAATAAGVVTVHAAARDFHSEAEKLSLVLVLLEKEIRYTGENSIRFHPMVARAVAAFPADPEEGIEITHRFDLAAASSAARRNLDELESKGFRGDTYHFAERRDSIDAGDLAVVAFVEDATTHDILQAAWFDLSPKPGRGVTE